MFVSPFRVLEGDTSLTSPNTALQCQANKPVINQRFIRFASPVSQARMLEANPQGFASIHNTP